MRLLVFFLVFMSALLSSASARAQMDIYDFTYDFIECVKRFDSESGEFVRHGNTESSLMNGREVLQGAALGNNYWSYMDCLSQSRSGAASASSLPILVSCPEREITYAGGRVYIPPGLDGKRVGISNFFFQCVSGSWQNITGQVVNPIGANESTKPPVYKSCPSENITRGECTFGFGATENGYNAEDYFGQVYGDANAAHEGYALATCVNGELDVVTSSCTPNQCEFGESLSWGAPSAVDGQWASCTGDVALDGVVNAERETTRYYSSLLAALNNTKITTGRAEFNCSNGRWRIDPRVSTCEVKPKNGLRCQFILSSNERKYYCE
jgi:hypothetical protein